MHAGPHRHATRRGASVIALAALALFTAPPPAHAFLDALTCGMDPLYDLCVSFEIEERAGDLPRGFQRDRAHLDAYLGWHFAHRDLSDLAYRYPDPAQYRDDIAAEEMQRIVSAVHAIMIEEDADAAEAEIGAIERASIQRLAYVTLSRAFLHTGDNERALAHLRLYRDAVETIERPPARLQPLADLAWYFARAGDTESATESLDAMLAIANSHPIAQLRPIFSVEAAPAEYLLDGEEAALARIEAANDELEAMSNLPPGFEAQTRSVFAKAYGRIGHPREGRANAQTAITGIDELEPGQQVSILRNIFDAGFEF